MCMAESTVAAPEKSSSRFAQPQPEAEELYRRWIGFLDEEFTRHQAAERRAEIVRDQLFQLYLGRPHGGKLNFTLTSELPLNVLQLSLDPANISLEAEHYPDVDRERFARSKPLLWFWIMFDRSPIGLNHWLGIRFRCMLGRHLFAKMGKSVAINHGVELTYGYNLSIEDGVIVRQRALLDDRAEIHIGKGAVIGTYARIYSHSHRCSWPGRPVGSHGPVRRRWCRSTLLTCPWRPLDRRRRRPLHQCGPARTLAWTRPSS